jgi:hypothetical protein
MTHTVLLAAASFALAAAAADFPEPAKLPSRPDLPDPLVMLDGTPVKTREQWVEKRRPELKALFQHYMYGQLPPAEKVEAKVEREDKKAFDGKATLKEVTLSFGPPDTPKIHLLLVTPNDRKGPAPVFLGMNFCGNHCVVKDPKVALPTVWDASRRGREGQPRHRRGSRHAGGHVGHRAVHRPRLRRGHLL